VTRTLSYDPLNRLDLYNPGTSRRFAFDPTTGQPVMEYAGSGIGSNFHHYYGADERGSVVSLTDSSGALIGIDTYDEYGKRGAANIGRFQYTGQKWLGEIGAYDYKARVYTYDVENKLKTAVAGGVTRTLSHDPLNRLDV
jgi:transglutaminase-like putative cysteine protease